MRRFLRRLLLVSAATTMATLVIGSAAIDEQLEFETQMAAMTRSAANSAAQPEKWLSSIGKASNGDFTQMGQQASRS